ncbi:MULTISPECIES: reverse transcriptase family protein [unclassified Thioalkalivibrio]|uniref:reverse transcriptase family protein n=1 Tax=unclassified Thioalkalivibrio TaxID=2621013 RepID=UPI0012DBEE9A|nr:MULTISPECIES: reverse transcriptase family protein [unclassified Thioalkalivibrio]
MPQKSAKKPHYPYKPIGSVETLARMLGVHPKILTDIANRTDDSYTDFTITTPSGKERNVSEPKFTLKKIQKRINRTILEKVEYPLYLMGGIRDLEEPRDYVSNASAHAGASTIIKLDIKNFYPNIRRQNVYDIFRYLLRFPEPVSDLLTTLCVRHHRLPQGACTSSYLANLIFFNAEYQLAASFERQAIAYTRLLDDITISSPKQLTPAKTTEIIRSVAAMCKKHGLKLNNKKTRVDRVHQRDSDYIVTGLWAKHSVPKVPRHERRAIRKMVHDCENRFTTDPASPEYHSMWNQASGKIAKLKRLGHSQAQPLRARMRKILPQIGDQEKDNLILECKKLANKSRRNTDRIGHILRVNRAIHKVGLLSRTDKRLARSLRRQVVAAYPNKPTIKDYWEIK